MPQPQDRAVHRADRILDAATALLGRYGYRKLTIDDIAHQAGVGKGTVYLHWRTKQQLFEALVLRESVGYIEELLDSLRADPTNVLPRRLLVQSFLLSHRRPVFRALMIGDLRPLYDSLLDGPLSGLDLLVTERFFELLTSYGLLRSDIPHPRYTVSAATAGFHLIGDLDPGSTGLDLRAKAEAMEHTVRYAFEPSKPPAAKTLAKATAEIIVVFEQLIPPYRKHIYAYDRMDDSG